MRSSQAAYHIHHNVTPAILNALLRSCKEREPTTIYSLADELGMQVGTLQHIVPLGRYCGLLAVDSLTLTDLGTSLYQLGQQSTGLFPEAMHQLLYTSYYSDSDKRFSWAYAQVVDALWTSGERTIDQATVAHLVGMVIERAAQTYNVPPERIAFSHNSVLGIRYWLRALDPPVLSNSGKKEMFRRRSYCSAIVLLWAVDALYRITQTSYGVRMFLTPERAEQLCRICVLDPSGLDNVLMLAKRTSDYERGGLFDYGTAGGFGRWLLLAKPCSVGSLPEAS